MKRILCIPYAPILGDVRRNSARIVELAHAIAATEMHPDLVVFPELTLSGYLLESLVAEAAVSREDLTALAENLTATGMPAGTVIASPFEAVRFAVHEALASALFRVFANTDVHGVELGGLFGILADHLRDRPDPTRLGHSGPAGWVFHQSRGVTPSAGS